MSNSDNVVGAVLLAAGRSERFGPENKLLAAIDGRPVVRRAARTLLAASLDDRIAVVGHDAAAVGKALPEGFTIRYNDRYREGQHTSVRAGTAVARKAGWDGALFALGDMPAVDPTTVDALLKSFAEGTGSVVVPTESGSRGNPVLFGASHFDALAEVTGDRGGRALIAACPGVVRVPVDDTGIHRDVDRPEDLNSVRE
ncbi:molybdenum cofactor nucleotidyltransferase domain protein [Natronomonas moolapensis 8.8.11]|uniref:Molybdenum cofactor nucleotidyltransferase domain protein n=1 Tax=Natronomonas moolapensis (strain DSM 18674 / CECT 7526 / JCM 14361 / 8.8.11) TaxID=268739 RepID=M1XTF9_NATM8|nr:nucleotidyltransferase family protein [Natronomonas moolapensis]CCQ37745.1 molybdenum cofactor nucleotidyltransferase domain protein [Natronomonas moolapensis 8.8.11]